MSTNPNTKTYQRRVKRLARELRLVLSFEYSDKSVTDIMAAVDPKATRTMRDEAIKLAIEDCISSERSYMELADQHRIAETTLREFREPPSLRVIEGGKS